jgi:hypothetical protein
MHCLLALVNLHFLLSAPALLKLQELSLPECFSSLDELSQHFLGTPE